MTTTPISDASHGTEEPQANITHPQKQGKIETAANDRLLDMCTEQLRNHMKNRAPFSFSDFSVIFTAGSHQFVSIQYRGTPPKGLKGNQLLGEFEKAVSGLRKHGTISFGDSDSKTVTLIADTWKSPIEFAQSLGVNLKEFDLQKAPSGQTL